MKKLLLACAAAGLLVSAAAGQARRAADAPSFRIVEATIPEMRAAMEYGRLTSRALVEPVPRPAGDVRGPLHAAIFVNPHALEEADQLDRERAQGRIRGPLHGIPVALKDNIHTTDMPTTGGALAFAGYVPPYEATLTKNLRDAGAIIIAKTGLTELANWVAGAPDPMPGNYNAVGGFGYNPYDPRPDPREATFDGRPALQTGGSSSGIGTAANLWAANVGTDTGGSVISPSNANMLVGIRPTLGRISRYGVIPITADHDTAGPMTRTVTDAAIMLGALESASPDPNDPATTHAARRRPGATTRQFLQGRTALKGARIGIPRAFYYDRASTLAGRSSTTTRAAASERGAGEGDGRCDRRAEAAGRDRRRSRRRPEPRRQGPEEELPLVGLLLRRAIRRRARTSDCSVNFKYGMKRDFNPWLKSLGAVGAGEDADGAARVEHGARRRPARSNSASRGSTSRTKWISRRDRARNDADHKKDWLLSRDARHRRRAEGAQTRRDPHSGRRRRRPRRARRLSDHRRAVRDGSERAEPAVPAGLQREAGAVRRRLHRHGVQRAAADRARLRVRAGDPEASPSTVGAVSASRKTCTCRRIRHPARSYAEAAAANPPGTAFESSWTGGSP